MAGEASWITLFIMIVGAVFVLGLLAAGLATKGFRRSRQLAKCPATWHGATLVTLQSERSGRHTDVITCSELQGEVTCARTCLAQLNPPFQTS
jgi:hypothetical protein